MAKKKIIFLIILAFVVRMLWLKSNLFFGFEQGRDLLKVQDVLQGNFTLVGPKTDIDGVFHGALSYYILVPLYLVTGGSPLGILTLLIAVHVVSIFFLYLLVKDIADEHAAMISSIFFSVSYPLIIYARWLSNPNLVLPLTIFILFCCVRARKNSKYIIGAFSAFALLCHLQIAVAILLVVPLIFLAFKLQLFKDKKSLVIALGIFLMMMSPYLIFEMRNNMIMTNSLIAHFRESSSASISRWKTLDPFYDHIMDFFFTDHRWWSFTTFALLVGYSLVKLKKNKIVPVIIGALLFPPVVFYIVNFSPLRHFYNASPIFIIILAGVVISDIGKKHKALATFLISGFIILNLWTYIHRIPENVSNFLYLSQRMYLSDEENLIDYAYKNAAGKQFSYEYYSIPYWHNEAWAYLLSWYGETKYGYKPSEEKSKVFYVFMEPDERQPQYQHTWYADLNKYSLVTSSYTSRHLTVEVREMTK